MKAKTATWISIAYLNHYECSRTRQFSESKVKEMKYSGVVQWVERRRSRLWKKGQAFLVSYQHNLSGILCISLIVHGALARVVKLSELLELTITD